MRITLTLDDQLAQELKEIVHRTGKPFKDVVNDTLQSGLQSRGEQRPPKRYRLKTVSLGGVHGNLNLDKALSLADALEDDEIVRKLVINSTKR
jgi:metal-responsive CopG/Arc/MetJ family transcriptional regulator